jgi:hypothetical protein
MKAYKGHKKVALLILNLDKVKGKAFPLQAWSGPWGSKRLRLQNF